MTAILLVSHGNFSKALLETAEMILGPQEHVAAVGLQESDSPELLREKLEAALQGFQGMPTLVLTDLFSGTPFNTVVGLSRKYSFRHLTGINLPLLNQALISRDISSLEELAQELLEEAAASVQDVDAVMARQTGNGLDDLDDL